MARTVVKGSGRVVANALTQNSGLLATFVNTGAGVYLATMAANESFGPRDVVKVTTVEATGFGSGVERVSATQFRVRTTTLGGGAALADADFDYRVTTVDIG